MAHMSNYLITEAEIAAGGTFVSAPIDIEKAQSACLHLQALTGASADIGYSYTISTSSDGTFLTGQETTSGSETAVGLVTFTPEPASYLILTITNNNGAAVVTPRVVLALQDFGGA